MLFSCAKNQKGLGNKLSLLSPTLSSNKFRQFTHLYLNDQNNILILAYKFNPFKTLALCQNLLCLITFSFPLHLKSTGLIKHALHSECKTGCLSNDNRNVVIQEHLQNTSEHLKLQHNCEAGFKAKDCLKWVSSLAICIWYQKTKF